jgi:hypothetical protein
VITVEVAGDPGDPAGPCWHPGRAIQTGPRSWDLRHVGLGDVWHTGLGRGGRWYGERSGEPPRVQTLLANSSLVVAVTSSGPSGCR